MSGSLLPNAKQQFFDANGIPLAGGKVYYYIPYTTTPKNTYQDLNLTILNTNPIVLDAAGECIAWGAGTYRQQVYDVNGNLIWDQNTVAINPTGNNFISQEEVQTATQGQTLFTLTAITYTPGINSLVVFVNGSKQIIGTNYTETSSVAVTFVTGLNAGDVVDFYASLPVGAQNMCNAVSVAYYPPFTNSVATNVQSKLAQTVSVKDFGADSTGTNDSSLAFQSALTSLSSSGGCLHIPVGSYLLNSQVTYTGKSLQIIGDGIEVTKILVNNSTGGFSFTFTTTTVTTDFLKFSGMSIVANGSLNNGIALQATWPNTSTLPSAPETIIRDISIRSNVYAVNTSSTSYFTECIKLTNLAAARLEDIYVSQIGNSLAKGLHINNESASSAFYVKMDGVVFEGLAYGVYSQGWLESVHINNCEFASPYYCLYFLNDTATSYLPLIRVTNTHLNAVKQCAFFQSFQDIVVDGVNFTIFNDSANTTDSTIYGLYFNGCQNVKVVNSFLATYPSASTGVATSCDALLLQACSEVLIANNQFDISLGGSQSTGFGIGDIANSTRVMVTDNQFRSALGSSGVTYILAQPALYSNERIEVSDNQFNDGSVGVQYVDVANGTIKNNKFDGTGTGVIISGSTVPNSSGLIIYNNYPTQEITLPVNTATPSVGSAINNWFSVNNTSATTITNFLNGYEGQIINLLFANGNTTIQSNSNVFTLNGSNFTGSTGSIMSLTYVYGVWRTTLQKT